MGHSTKSLRDSRCAGWPDREFNNRDGDHR